MFDSSRLRRRLFIRPLEDRLPPGDIFLSGLFMNELGLSGQPGWPTAHAAPPAFRAADGTEPARPTDTGEPVRLIPPSRRDDSARSTADPTRPVSADPLFGVPAVGVSSARFSVLPPWAKLAGPALAGPATAGGPFTPTPVPYRAPGNTPAEALKPAERADLPVSFRAADSAAAAAASPAAVGTKMAGDGGKLTGSFTRTEILVGVRGDDPLAAVREWAAKNPDPATRIDAAGSRVLLAVNGVSTVEVRLGDGADPLAAVDRFAAMPRAAWAEPNYVFTNAKDWTPNDLQYTDPGQYFHTKSQTNLAWDVTKGSPTVTIGIADDGVGHNHPDLAPNVWANPGETPGDGLDNDGNGYIDDIRGWDFSDNDATPLPAGADTHGTHVAGISAARSNNLTGVAGTAGGDDSSATASGARLVNLRWIGGATGWTASVVSQTYRYAADTGVKIVNASYNFDGWAGNATVDAALTYAYDKGVLIMNSAGNSGTLGAPRGVFTQPLFVASLDSADARSDFSNYGAFVDVAAHGSDILSTLTSAAGTGASYGLNSGTSMSTPHAAGVAALIWSQNPTWTRDQVAAQLLGTADSVDAVAGNVPGSLGTGRVNANRGVTQTLAAAVFTNFVANPESANPNQTAGVTVTVPRRLAPAAVVAANFDLRSDGADNTFDTADDTTLAVTVNGGDPYRMGTNTLTFVRTDGNPLPVDRYRFTGFSGAAKLRDVFGAALDGDANGTAGGDFTAVFGGNPQITGTAFEDANGNAARNANDGGLAGRVVYLDQNGNGAFDSNAVSFPNTTPVPIPDVTTVTSTTAVSGVTGTITDVNVRVDITHEYDADLDVFLVSPGGTRVELFTDAGGAGQDFTNTVLDDEATVAITAGTAPFTGTYRPEGSLAALDGLTANGDWTLEITDDAAADVGTLNNWTLTIGTGTPEPSVTTDAGGSYAFLSPPNGTYPVRTLTPTGWSATGPAGGGHSVTVTGPADVFSGLDFGQAKNDRFYGSVWDDRDADGTLDAGEPPVAGRTVYLDTNGNGVLDVPAVNTFTTTHSPGLAIPDNNLTGVTSTKAVSGIVSTVTDIDVTINVTHPYVGDLRFSLIAPDGTTTIPLVTNRGGSGDNFTNTVFDDAAATAIGGGTAPFTGKFRPESPLSVLGGTTANGTWTLKAVDSVGADLGTLDNWTLTIASGLQEPSVVSTALGNAFLDLPSGANTVRLAPFAGFKFTSPSDGKYEVTAAGAPLYDRRFGVAEAVPPTVAGVAVSPVNPAGFPQRSRVLSLTVTFSERVVLPATPASAFTLTPAAGGTVALNATVDDTGPATVVTLTFADTTDNSSLIDGRYTLTVLAAQVRDVAQNPMAANSTTALHRLFGDQDGDADNDTIDLARFRQAFGAVTADANYRVYFDFEGDGDVDTIDLARFRQRFGITLP